MTHTWFIDNGDITKHRSTRVGASEIACLLPNPEKPNESLDGYRTAVDLFNEKTGRKKREPAGLAAEMGHLLEPAAVELFMRELFGIEASTEWFIRRMQYEILLRKARMTGTGWPRAETYQVEPIAHSIEYYTDQFIVHPDGIYKPGTMEHTLGGMLPATTKAAHGLTFDLSRPFLLEAKSARYWSALRPPESMVTGYNMELRTWQGIPLKHYVQIQFQLAILEVDVCYLPLLFDTSEFQVWEIRADRAVQNKLIDLAGRMAWHVQHDTPPKELAMNADDIIALYPTVAGDFVYVSGDEAAAVREACGALAKAKKQEALWKGRAREASDTLAVHLKDRKELRDSETVLARWIEREGSDRVKALGKIEKENPVEYRYLRRKGLIETGDGTRYPSAVWKGEE
jgi:predicted phage-related endonuclease